MLWCVSHENTVYHRQPTAHAALAHNHTTIYLNKSENITALTSNQNCDTAEANIVHVVLTINVFHTFSSILMYLKHVTYGCDNHLSMISDN